MRYYYQKKANTPWRVLAIEFKKTIKLTLNQSGLIASL